MSGLTPLGSHHARHRLVELLNAAHPLWRTWRACTGYFVVEQRGDPVWVGRADPPGMKAAFCRWVEARSPLVSGNTVDGSESVLLVALRDGNADSVSPGRVI